jgi:hypothetical protein
MPDAELRDATFEVEVELPNQAKIAGRSIPWRKGLQIKGLLHAFYDTEAQEDFDKVWELFSTATGITEQRVTELCPSITYMELINLINRFIYLLRPGRTGVQVPTPTPVSTAAP